MPTERQVSLFRNGRNQALRIPREFELEGSTAIIRKEGDQLIIEAVQEHKLAKLLKSWRSTEEDFSKINDPELKPGEIF